MDRAPSPAPCHCRGQCWLWFSASNVCTPTREPPAHQGRVHGPGVQPPLGVVALGDAVTQALGGCGCCRSHDAVAIGSAAWIATALHPLITVSQPVLANGISISLSMAGPHDGGLEAGSLRRGSCFCPHLPWACCSLSAAGCRAGRSASAAMGPCWGGRSRRAWTAASMHCCWDAGGILHCRPAHPSGFDRRPTAPESRQADLAAACQGCRAGPPTCWPCRCTLAVAHPAGQLGQHRCPADSSVAPKLTWTLTQS